MAESEAQSAIGATWFHLGGTPDDGTPPSKGQKAAIRHFFQNGLLLEVLTDAERTLAEMEGLDEWASSMTTVQASAYLARIRTLERDKEIIATRKAEDMKTLAKAAGLPGDAQIIGRCLSCDGGLLVFCPPGAFRCHKCKSMGFVDRRPAHGADDE